MPGVGASSRSPIEGRRRKTVAVASGEERQGEKEGKRRQQSGGLGRELEGRQEKNKVVEKEWRVWRGREGKAERGNVPRQWSRALHAPGTFSAKTGPD